MAAVTFPWKAMSVSGGQRLPRRPQKYDLAALDKEWNRRVTRIGDQVETVPDVTTDIQMPADGNRHPTLTVKWDEAS